MPEKVTIREDLQIIQVESFGEVSGADLKGSLEGVIKLHQESGLTRVFVDTTRQTSMPSAIPIYEFGAELARAVRSLKFAVLKSQNLGDDLTFLANVAQNRGAQVCVFDSAEDALAWLLEDKNGPDEGDST